MNKAWMRMTPSPLTGTAAGPMTAADRLAYELGWAAQRLAIDLTHPLRESTLVHMDAREPTSSECNCNCLDCRDGVHDRRHPGCPR